MPTINQLQVKAYQSTSAPTANDDSTKGFLKGATWINTSTNTYYICLDNTATTAVWILTYQPHFTSIIYGSGIAEGATSTSTAVFGESAGAALTNGSFNTLMGNDAGKAITTGSGNTLIGADAGDAIVGANDNTVIGSGSMRGTGAGNTVMGANAAPGSLSGSNNTVYGNGAAASLTSGGTNVVVGNAAAPNLSTGSGNVIIGTGAAASETGSNKLHIGNGSISLLSGDFSSATLTLNADVTIAGTTPTLTIGDAGEEDTSLVFDGNAQDYYLGLDDTDDKLKLGRGSAVGTTSALEVDTSGNVTLNGLSTLDQTSTNTVKSYMVVTETGTSRTLSASDNGKFIYCTNAGAVTITLPQNSTEDLVDGFNAVIIRNGPTSVTFQIEGADVLVSADSLVKIRTNGAQAVATKITDALWWLGGDLTA